MRRLAAIKPAVAGVWASAGSAIRKRLRAWRGAGRGELYPVPGPPRAAGGVIIRGMNSDPTLSQDGPQRLRAQERSLQSVRPPTSVPGYDLEQLLGTGAFGEVWLAVERNTGRRVAIKFYAHRGGLDWSLLSREVEKLTFLFADRHVVQLIGVGWDAEPPYYVMEYMEHGSLADRLQSRPLSCAEAVAIIRDVAIGLIHAHGKGVLHCDLKPGNVLLDQDQKPRLADFGQSRLFREQTPALGTLFYMAPEQANLEAVPDARWDVYALGALLYSMLTGSPPHRDEASVGRLNGIDDFRKRLAEYRSLIRRRGAPSEHRQMRGVDRALAEIIERCLAPDAKKRYPNVQSVLDALDAREARRARRPAMLLGTFGPALVLLVVSLFVWRGFNAAVERSRMELVNRALKTNQFAARSVAKAIAANVDRRCRAVEQLIASDELIRAFHEATENPQLIALSKQLCDPNLAEEQLEPLRERFRAHPVRRGLQAALEAAIPAEMVAGKNVNSWFLDDSRGLQIARVPEEAKASTVGRWYAWRSYFHGGPADLEPGEKPAPGVHLERTSLSPAYRSEALGIWNVAVSTPIRSAGGEEFLGVAGLSVGVGRLVESLEAEDRRSQFAVLVERPLPDTPGHILEHPVMSAWENGDHASGLQPLRIGHDAFPATAELKVDYRDPAGQIDPAYRQRWLADSAEVISESGDTGWSVIVEESYETAIGATLGDLRAGLIAYSWRALLMVVVVVVGLWGVAYRLLEQSGPARLASLGDGETPGASATSRSAAEPTDAPPARPPAPPAPPAGSPPKG